MQDLHISSEQKQISNQTVETLYSKADILYFLVHPAGDIESCNVTVEDVLDYDMDTLQGTSIFDLVSARHRELFNQNLHLAAKRGFVRDILVVFKTRNGQSKTFKVNGLSHSDDKGNVQSVSFYMQDITEIVLLKKQQKFTELILEFSEIKQQSDRQTHEFLKSIQKLDGCSLVGWFKKDANGETSIFGTWMQADQSQRNDLPRFSTWSLDKWHKFFNLCTCYDSFILAEGKSRLVRSRSQLINNTSDNEIPVEIYDLENYESLLVVPQYQDESLLGYFVLMDETPDFWQDDDLVFFDKWLNRIAGNQIHQNNSQINMISLDQFRRISNLGVMLTVDGKILDVNDWIVSYLHYDREELLEKRLTDLIPLEYQEMIAELASEDNDSTVHDIEVALLSHNGKRRRVLCTSLSYIENNRHSIIWFFVDKESEHLLKKHLLQARKMEALGLLAGGIVHDFKNLLAGIEGYSSLLCEDIPDESPFHEDVQQIGKITQKAIEQTARLLAFSEGGTYQVDDLNVNDIIREVATMLSRTTDKKMIIRAELEDEIKLIRADASQIQHAILQVSLNSRDAMPKGGKLIFQTKNMHLKQKDSHLKKGFPPGNYIQISISDTGMGMNNMLKEKMFEPFFTSKDKCGGKGLGLQIVKEIIENHHGFFTIFSQQGQGTVFKILLPAEDSNIDDEEESMNGKLLLGKENILLIDTDKILREATRKMLSRYGYKVISASSSDEAVHIYRKNVGRIDLILYDLSKPENHSNQHFQMFKKMNPKLKIVVTSNVGEKNFIDGKSMKYISGHIEKPFEVRSLLKDVRRFLNG